jgi:hypothetical protein
MQQFDVVVVGGGPAGGYGAYLLAQKGYKVLLVEQHSDFTKNNFSSAATPLETLTQFDLPSAVVAQYWRKLAVISTHEAQEWSADKPLGAVFDFAKLRSYLAEKVTQQGGMVWLGHRYLNTVQEGEKTLVQLKRSGGEVITIAAQIVVDATGYARAVIYPQKSDRPSFYKATGIEYLITVDEQTHTQYAESLLFFLGYRWSPRGYSWIFPMDNYQLKVGSAWIDAEHQYLKTLKPLRDYTKALITDYLQLDHYQLVEIHGSILEYSSHLEDTYYRDNLIAIGDAVSTVNFLGGEGIRHGMQGAAIAVPYIEAYLQDKKVSFSGYEKAMKDYFGQKWNVSEAINRKVYLQYDDAKIDLGVAYLKYLSFDDAIDILFNYKFDKLYRGIYPFILKKINKLVQGLKRWLVRNP